ncbi:serine/arginine repetitive matrix protein 2-like [Brachionichthys hirsutus]|uniref:serine/arginine repetitive matrix protein 2-like n=1 Tax=Brachionichthys hirsutus TaxID=412623 RepID=UPI003604D3E7
MDISPSDEKVGKPNGSGNDGASPLVVQDEITQTATAALKTEDNHADGAIGHAQELPDIIPKQEGATPREEASQNDNANSAHRTIVEERDGSRSRSPSPSKGLEMKRTESSHSVASPPQSAPIATAEKEVSPSFPRPQNREGSHSPPPQSHPRKVAVGLGLPPALAPPKRKRQSRERSPSLLSAGGVRHLFPQSAAEVPVLPKEGYRDPLNAVAEDPPLCLVPQREAEDQSRAPVAVQGAPGPGHLEEVVRLAGAHGHGPSPGPVAPDLDQDALPAAPGHGPYLGAEEAGAPEVDPCPAIKESTQTDQIQKPLFPPALLIALTSRKAPVKVTLTTTCEGEVPTLTCEGEVPTLTCEGEVPTLTTACQGCWKPVISAAAPSPPSESPPTESPPAESPPTESPPDDLQVQTLASNDDGEERESANLPNDEQISRSRSASVEPGASPEKSEHSGGSDEEQNSSPVKTLLRLLSFAAQKSKSPSPAEQEKPSRSASSKSPVRKRESVSPSERKRRRSKSHSPARRRRSRSPARRKRSRSKSRTRLHRSRTRSPARKKRSRSPSGRGRRRSKSTDRSRRSKSRSTGRRKRSRSGDRSRRSRSRSSDRRRRSRSRGRGRRPPFRSRSFDRRDRWKREPSHSPVLILRKQRRSGSRTRRSTSKSPPRLTELDKDQLLEIAKANAAAMCAKAGVPIPESLRPKAILQLPLPTPSPTPLSLPLPLPLPMGMGMPNMGPMGMPNIPGMPSMSNITMSAAMASMTAATMTAALTNMGALAAMPPLAPLPTITNKPPPCLAPPTPSLNLNHIEEVKRKVTQQANIHTIKELTEKCKMIANSKEEMTIAKPHVSDDET